MQVLESNQSGSNPSTLNAVNLLTLFSLVTVSLKNYSSSNPHPYFLQLPGSLRLVDEVDGPDVTGEFYLSNNDSLRPKLIPVNLFLTAPFFWTSSALLSI